MRSVYIYSDLNVRRIECRPTDRPRQRENMHNMFVCSCVYFRKLSYCILLILFVSVGASVCTKSMQKQQKIAGSKPHVKVGFFFHFEQTKRAKTMMMLIENSNENNHKKNMYIWRLCRKFCCLCWCCYCWCREVTRCECVREQMDRMNACWISSLVIASCHKNNNIDEE